LVRCGASVDRFLISKMYIVVENMFSTHIEDVLLLVRTNDIQSL